MTDFIRTLDGNDTKTLFKIVLKDGRTQQVLAHAVRKEIPVYELYNQVMRGGRRVEELVRSIPIDDVTSIEPVEP